MATLPIPHFILSCEGPIGEAMAAIGTRNDHFLRSWIAGERFDPGLPALANPIEAHLKSSGAMPELDDGGIPLMTPRLRVALTEAGVSNIDYYDAVVRADDGQTWAYCAFNVIGKVAMADRAKSTMDPSIPWVDKLVVDPGAARGLPLFRLAESLSVLVVRADVREHILRSGIDTLTFTDPERWAG